MEKNNTRTDRLKADIIVPDFYDVIADVKSVDFYQGSHFVTKPHYDRQEQMMCAIDGRLSVMLVPHIYRQEVYADDLKDSIYFDKKLLSKDQPNVAAVNFFMPNLEKYPFFDNVQKFSVQLAKGDCVFIPAYYFHQIQGFGKMRNGLFGPKAHRNMTKEAVEDAKSNETYEGDKLAIAVSLRYQGNSQLLAGFYDAIENKVIN